MAEPLAAEGTLDTETAANITIEDIGPCRKKLSVEIPPSRVAAVLDEKFGSVAREAQLPGFRAGKAPTHLVRKRFGKAVRDEAKGQLVSEAYQQAVQENELRVLGDPEGGEELQDIELSPSEPVNFTLEVEVAPDFDVPSMEGVEIMRPGFEVTDDMIDQEVERLCTNEGELESLEKAERGDYGVGHGIMRAEGVEEPIHDIEGAVIQVPPKDKGDEGMILGVKVEDFARQVGTPKKGDTVTVTTTGPESHEIENVRGKKLTITFEINEIHRVKPAEPDQVAKKFGMEGADQLRDAIRSRLESRVASEQQSAMRQQVAERLIEQVQFELPENLTSRQAERTLQRRRFDLMQRGVDEKEIEERLADMRAASKEQAQNELKLFFILDKAAAEAEIGVTEPEVNGYIARMAAERGRRPEQLRAELIQQNQIQGIAQQIREHKTLDSLISKATIKDVSLDEFRQATGEEESAGSSAPAKKKSSTKKSSTKKSTSKKSSSKKTSSKKSTTKKKSSKKSG